MEASDRPLRRDGYLMQELDDEIVLFDPNKTQALCLNATASLIWGLCDGGNTVAEMVQLLGDAFPDAEDVAADVGEALDLFSQHHAIQAA
jgi:hypothetical protein